MAFSPFTAGLFTAGQILTAAQMNTYIRDNIMAGGPIYATTAARNTDIPSPFVGQRAFITATNVNTQYNGTAWVEVAPIGTWTTFTPQLRTGTTNVPSTNNYGRYVQQGKMITAQAKVTATAGGTAGGVIKLSIPTGTMTQGTDATIGSFFVKDTGTAYYTGVAATVETGYVSGQAYNSSDNMGANTPTMTIVLGDVVSYAVVYEIS
jgi:hypothetical protein